MAWDANVGVRWAIEKLLADTTLTTLLGGAGKVYRKAIPQDETLPAVVVGIQAVSQRDGPIRAGANTHAETPAVLQVSIWDYDNYDTIEEITARIDELLDGQVDQAESNGGQVIYCIRGTDQERSNDKADPPEVGLDTYYGFAAKAAV